MTRTPSNGNAVYWSRDTDGDMWQCAHHWLEFWWHDPNVKIILSIISIKNEKLLNSNKNRSKPELLRLLWDIVIFRLVAYLLNMTCLILRILYKIYTFWYNFHTVLYQFLETGTSDRTLIGLNNSWYGQVSAYPPLSFFLYTVPLIKFFPW